MLFELGWIVATRSAFAVLEHAGHTSMECLLPTSLRESRFLMAYSHPY
jgi:hypothetical protein